MKACNNCYWESICKKSKEQICDDFSYECELCRDQAEVIYEEKPLCRDCVFSELEVESWTVEHYTLDGCYLGNNDENSLDDILCDVEGVEILDE